MAKITGGPHRGHAAGDTDIEKQASQLASDVKYKVKKKLSGATHMNPAQIARAYEEQLNRSKTAGTPPAVIALAKKKLMGAPKPAVRKEEFDNGSELATESVANALYKVFVEKKEVNVDEQIKELKEAYSKVNKKGERLYHIIVTDKKTGNTYTRDATREKIAELRANPNISSVEMSERQLDSEKEKTKGANTARVKAGKGLDPVGKEDNDPDNDGTPINRDKNDQYIMKRRAAIGKAIAGRGTQKEEFLGEVNDEAVNPDANEKEIDVMQGKNTVKINPEVPGTGKNSSSYMQVAHYDMLGNPLSESEAKFFAMIQEKAESEQQQKLFGLALSVKRGETPRSEVSAEVLKIVDTMSEKKIRDFAKTKHKGLPETVKESGYFPTPEAQKKDEAKYNLRGQTVNPRTPQTQAGAKMKPSAPMKEETVSQADKKAKKEMEEKDPRSLPTAINLAKNYARAMGAKNPIVMVSTEETEVIDERRKEDKVAKTPRKPRNPAFELVANSMGTGRMGVQPRGQTRLNRQASERTENPETKELERKRPASAGPTPAQKVANRRAAAQRAQDMYKPRAGESD